MTAAFDMEALPVSGITETLERIRKQIGCTDRAAYWNMSLVELAAAQAREANCGVHGQHRVSACGICRRLGR